MKKITVISGKGGTGKTTVTSNLAALADNIVIADCDVDAPNMHLLLNPEIIEDKVFKGGKLAVKDNDKCINCGICEEVCNFGAITPEFEVNPIKCEGCGVCVAMCPTHAFELVEEETGHIFKSKTEFGPMIHAKLKVGGENSGKLVSEVRNKADKLAEEEKKDIVLIDGSPGIGCPVIASLNGVDASLIVTEPTKSGLSDLKRVLEVTDHFGIKSMLVINKYDLNIEISDEIEDYCSTKNIPIIGKISFDSLLVETLREGKLIVKYKGNSRPAKAIKEIWKNLSQELGLI
jgi:MinD superfamily P-loop ATPase